MVQCPKCKRLTLPETRICPHCGEPLPLMPELSGERVRQIANRRPLSGAGDYVMWGVGFLLGLLSPAFLFVGYIVVGIVWLASKDRQTSPILRGMGIGLLLATLLLLGAFALCLYAVIGPHSHGGHY